MGRREGRETLGRFFGSTGRRILLNAWSQVEILGRFGSTGRLEMLGRFGSTGRRILWNEVELSNLLWQMGSRWRRRWRRLERSTSGWRGFEMVRRGRRRGTCLRRRLETCLKMLIGRGKVQRVALA